MPAPATPTEIETPGKHYLMRLLHANYLHDIPPKRFPAGSVILVSGETAFRWMEHGVAEPAPPGTGTYRDEVREKKARYLAQLEAMGAVEHPFNTAIRRESFADEGQQDRDLMPREMPKRRGRLPRAAQLPGVAPLNGPSAPLPDDDGRVGFDDEDA